MGIGRPVSIETNIPLRVTGACGSYVLTGAS